MFKKIKSIFSGVSARFGAVLLGASAVVTSATQGHCALDLSTISFDFAPLETLMATIVGGLAVLWVYRKITKTTNRS